jgi:hypothetical protein
LAFYCNLIIKFRKNAKKFNKRRKIPKNQKNSDSIAAFGVLPSKVTEKMQKNSINEALISKFRKILKNFTNSEKLKKKCVFKLMKTFENMTKEKSCLTNFQQTKTSIVLPGFAFQS